MQLELFTLVLLHICAICTSLFLWSRFGMIGRKLALVFLPSVPDFMLVSRNSLMQVLSFSVIILLLMFLC